MEKRLWLFILCLLILCLYPHTVEAANRVCANHQHEVFNGHPACVNEGQIHNCSNNFKDPAFRNYLLTRVDSNKDGYMTAQDTQGLTYLKVANNSIVSLAGIEYFPNLKTLNCEGNKIKELDVSQLTQLETLNCSRNKLC